MSEGRDPTIKLFGRKIPLPEDQPLIEGGDIAEPTPEVKQDTAGEKDTQEENDKVATSMSVAPQELNLTEPLHCSGSSSSTEVDQNPSAESAITTEELDHDEDHKGSNSLGDGKVLKKPDKVLPCPRCTSMETKFCYYNNYNVNQPRHFCKNCQRYWTAGGTMRNVPVGAGRRKNKHSASSYRALASLQADGSAVTHHQALSSDSSAHRRSLKENGTLQSGAEAPLCESMASALNLGEGNRTCELGFTARRENREEPSCSSSGTGSKYAEKAFLEFPQHNATPGYQNGVTPFHHLQSFPGPPGSAYHWISGWSNAAAASMTEAVSGQENGILLPLSCIQAPMAAAPAFHAPTFPLQFPFPFPFVPAPFWGWNGPWNFPWAANGNVLSPSSYTSTSNRSGHGSPTLGKHSRDATSLGEEKKEKSLWIPKTLRIDDPEAAAKSSIFATLGIKVDEVCLFKSSPSGTEKVQVLHANPAALSRSQSFHEAT